MVQKMNHKKMNNLFQKNNKNKKNLILNNLHKEIKLLQNINKD